MRTSLSPLWVIAIAGLMSCSGGDASQNPVADAAIAADTAPSLDAAVAPDTAPDTPPGSVFGPIDGACGALAAELTSTSPSFHETTWHLAPAKLDPATLRPGAKARFDGENAGGSSKCSEIMSMQHMYECEGATTWKLEVEVDYDMPGSITDWVADFAGTHVGVSVTRAYKGPVGQSFTADDAKALLTKKLAGINESTANVTAEDAWVKQILHVWTLRPDWVPVLRAAWEGLDATLRADTIVLVTIEDGGGWVVSDSCDDL